MFNNNRGDDAPPARAADEGAARADCARVTKRQRSTSSPRRSAATAGGFEFCETCTTSCPATAPRRGVVFVGEAPGAKEDKQGRPFVGAAGKLRRPCSPRPASCARTCSSPTSSRRGRRGTATPSRRGRALLAVAGGPARRHRARGCSCRSAATRWPASRPPRRSPRSTAPCRRARAARLFPIYHPAAALYNGGLRATLVEDAQALGPRCHRTAVMTTPRAPRTPPPPRPRSSPRRSSGATSATHDVAIDIAFAGICHCDIHQVDATTGAAGFPDGPGPRDRRHRHRGRRRASPASPWATASASAASSTPAATCEYCVAGEEQFCAKGVVGDLQRARATTGSDLRRLLRRTSWSTERFVVRMPDALELDVAAPLLCAGITMYSPLKRWGAGPGKRSRSSAWAASATSAFRSPTRWAPR